jgi:hypothetical protein
MPRICSLEWCDRPHYALGYLFRPSAPPFRAVVKGTPRRQAWP